MFSYNRPNRKTGVMKSDSGDYMRTSLKGWFSYNPRCRFDRRCQFKKWSYDWDDYMRTLQKRSLMPAAIGATAIAWIARFLSGRLVADRGDGSDSGDYMRTSLKGWFSYNPRYRFDRRCQFKKWSYDWDDYMRTLQKRSLMPAAIGATAIAWIARFLSGRLVADRGDGSDSGDYMRTSLK